MNFSRNNVRKKQKALASKAGKRTRKFALALVDLCIVAVIGVIGLGICAGVGAFRGVIDSAPDISNIDVTPTGFSTFVYDADGNKTAKLVSTDANRIPVSWDMIPENLAHAFVAIEDERFYDHPGIDIQGILRAGVKGLSSGNFNEGASTITQQLLKNSVFTGWTNETDVEKIKRKIQEQYLAIQLEKTMSKEDILLNYLNTINLGHNTLGVQAASQRYFGKSVADLTLSECAVIAGITQNPTKYDPITYPENNSERRDVVLSNMLDQGYITQAQYDEAKDDDVYSRIQTVNVETDDDEVNSYFVDALTNQVLEDLVDAGYTETQAYTLLYSGGLSIYSTQDSEIQKILDEECSNEANFPSSTKYLLDYALTVKNDDGSYSDYSDEMMKSWFQETDPTFTLFFSDEEAARDAVGQYQDHVLESGGEIYAESFNLTPQPQISMTVEDQRTGYVVAMVGGRGSKTANRTLNRATDTTRQPGSTFKVVSTYAPALDAAGMTLATVHDDAPFNYESGMPVRNWYGEAYRGLSTIRDGIRDSMNIIAVETLTDITPQLGYEYLLKFGFTTLVESETINGQVYSDIQQTLALGGLTKGVTNLELNASYATIANGGVYIKPKLYTKIVDHDGNVIIDNTQPEETRVLKETTAWLLTSAMEDVVTSGTGTAVNFGTTPIAGKTGTTSDYNDVWFAGYTNYYTATVWAGCDDNTKLQTSEEKALAKTIWRACMSRIHENLSYSDFSMPTGITQVTVCSKSGKLPVDGLCDATLKTEYFDIDTVPTETCDVHYSGMICAYSGLPATEYCPFQTEGVVTLEGDSYGQTCPHTAEFMAQEGIDAIIAAQQAEITQKNAAASLDEAVAYAQATATALQQAQSALAAAQQSGDEAAIQSAQAAVDQATADNDAAQAALAAIQSAINNTGGDTNDTGGGEAAGENQE